jgi:hypothetical protein
MHWDILFLPALAARALFLPVLVDVRELSRHDIVDKVYGHGKGAVIFVT